MKCDIYLKLWSYAQNCLICTLHPFYCEKKLSIRYGAHKPVRVSCSHCHVVDVMNDIILCSYTGFVLNVCLMNRCGKCTYMAINTFWIWIWLIHGVRSVETLSEGLGGPCRPNQWCVKWLPGSCNRKILLMPVKFCCLNRTSIRPPTVDVHPLIYCLYLEVEDTEYIYCYLQHHVLIDCWF